MKIGIDFDNTIACYDSSFHRIAVQSALTGQEWVDKTKNGLRDYLRTLPDGEKEWMRLQGQVYGKFMCQAEMMPGFAEFMFKCRLRGYTIYIVSHKTEYGHFDVEQISLRTEAMQWMESKRFFDPTFFGIEREHVFFADTREEKVTRIAELDCDSFIDDLPEVFAEPTFPDRTEKILYGNSKPDKVMNTGLKICSWEAISLHLLGRSAEKEEKSIAELMIGKSIATLEKVTGRGNSRIYKVITKEGNHYAMKIYPGSDASGRSRLSTEYSTIAFLRSQGLFCLPGQVLMNEDSNVALYSWVEGSTIDASDKRALHQAIEFISQLFKISKKYQQNKGQTSLASEACLSLSELARQVENRLKLLYLVSSEYPALHAFLEAEFSPLWQDVLEHARDEWPATSRTTDLEKHYRILSPSDFGFHNAISVDGNITFIDFEYFGWDDPVKLTADFLWHPGMQLEINICDAWRIAMLNLFSEDPDFASRLKVAMPLYGMRWIMILLNEFLPGTSDRRRLASGSEAYNAVEAQNRQLQKATQYFDRVASIRVTSRVLADNNVQQ